MIMLGVVRRLVDLVGLATLLPVVALVVYPTSVEGDSLMAALFRMTGLDSVARFGMVLGIFALVMLPLKSVLTIWLSDVQNRFLLAIYRSCSRDLYEHHHRKGVLFIRSTHSSQLSFHINGACWGFAMSIVGTLVGGGADLVMALGLSATAVWLAPGASLMVLGVMTPMMILWFGVVSGRLKRLGERSYEARRRQSRIVQESLRGHISMNVDDALCAVTEEFERGLEDISAVDRRSFVYGQIPSLIMQLCAALTLIVLLVSGLGGGSEVSTFILFGFAAVRLTPAVLSLAAGWNTLQNSNYIVDIIGGATGPGEASEKAVPMSFEREIEMRNITFAFEGGAPVLDGFSLTVTKGTSTGIRGESGAGKSTLFNLLLGFYVPQGGGVYIDGVRLSPATRGGWLRCVGYVEQDVFIRNDTLERNIAISAQHPDRGRIVRVLWQVGLGPWAEALPGGLDTVIGEGGSTLSGGERQRLGIARALYKDPQVLFLDEATASLDPAAEEELVELLHTLSKRGLTLFVISHRASALRHCDRVIEI
jgi:ABC-type multidrug transport system fused ATPase/permease subunit